MHDCAPWHAVVAMLGSEMDRRRRLPFSARLAHRKANRRENPKADGILPELGAGSRETVWPARHELASDVHPPTLPNEGEEG